MTTTTHQTALVVTGVNKSWAKRAIRYMADRSLLAYYDPRQRALCAFEFKHGRQWTYDAMNAALQATR